MQLLFMKPAYKLFQASSHPCEILAGYHAVLGNWTMERLKIQALSSPCLALQRFLFWKQKDSLAPQITLWVTLFVLYPHQGKDAAILLLPFIQAYVGLRRGMFALLLLLSQKQDPSRNESYNLIKMCKCVDYFWWFMDELLLPDSFSLCYFQL